MPTVAMVLETDKKLGQRMKELRHQRGKTAREVGRAIGKCRQQVNKYERGQDRIPASVLMVLAEVLEVDVKEFFGRSPLGVRSAGLSEAEREAVELMRALDEARVRRGLEALRDLVDERDDEEDG